MGVKLGHSQCGLRLFKHRVLRRIFGHKEDEVMVECRRLHNKELHDLYSSPNIVLMIKSRRPRWERHVTRMSYARDA
jgi:hypothetical protein